MFGELAPQSAAADAQPLRGQPLVPTAFPQHLEDMLPLHLIQGLHPRHCLPAAHNLVGKVAGLDEAGLAQTPGGAAAALGLLETDALAEAVTEVSAILGAPIADLTDDLNSECVYVYNSEKFEKELKRYRFNSPSITFFAARAFNTPYPRRSIW